jgi:hypothetical protein
MSQSVLLAHDADFAVGYWGDTFFILWKKNTTMEATQQLRGHLLEFTRSRPAGVGLLTIVEANAPVPGAEVRKALAAVLADFSRDIKASAVVFEGQGFSAAAVRSVVTGLTLIARQAYPHKVFGSLGEAGAWMLPQLPRQATQADLAAAVAGLRKLAA